MNRRQFITGLGRLAGAIPFINVLGIAPNTVEIEPEPMRPKDLVKCFCWSSPNHHCMSTTSCFYDCDAGVYMEVNPAG